MFDFTLKTYREFLQRLSSLPCGSFAAFVKDLSPTAIVLRHDVDKLPENSLAFARLQHELGVRGSYYFRIVSESFQPRIIEQIAGLGHEVGYHYEDVTLAAREMKKEGKREKGEGRKENGGGRRESGDRKSKASEEFEIELFERGIESFEKNLAALRQYADVKTICMHGSPLSKWDSRMLWEKHDYRDFGVIGEPYFDIDFTQVAYYTDTGRRWDGEAVSVRDKVVRRREKGERRQETGRSGERAMEEGKGFPRFHSTFEIIQAIDRGEFPQRAMFTFHPQRWTDSPAAWTRELVWQNVKNGVKKGIVVRQK